MASCKACVIPLSKACPVVTSAVLISFYMHTLAPKKRKGWFRLKRYPHIGLPLEPTDKSTVERYITSKGAIEKHAFLPFIHRKIAVRRFRREIDADGKRSDNRVKKQKDREVYYASHLDSNIYSFYADLINVEYKKVLAFAGLSNTVTAYLKVPLEPLNPNCRNKCNVDFANDVFTFIKSNPTDLVAITFDIKNFFDTLDHKILKKHWKSVMGFKPCLPEDHYNVFRNITKFSYLEESEIFNHFKDNILVERDKVIKAKPIDNRRYLRNQRAVAYCDKKGLPIIREKGLIKANKHIDHMNKAVGLRLKGIPQGSPISAVLANIYMLDFDKSANDYVNSIQGIYQRYSDDMVVVCPIKYIDEVIKYFHVIIKDAKLEIQDNKTQIFEFRYDSIAKRHYCNQRMLTTFTLLNTTNFEYLGFQFDGKFTLLKNSSLSSYYRKMKRSIAVRKFYAGYNKTKTKGEIFKSKLYKRFTHLGDSRRRIFTRHPHFKDQFILSNRYDWGNFLSYAKLASRNISNNKIKSQIRNHWNIFHRQLKK